jgi:hypothetical protein
MSRSLTVTRKELTGLVEAAFMAFNGGDPVVLYPGGDCIPLSQVRSVEASIGSTGMRTGTLGGTSDTVAPSSSSSTSNSLSPTGRGISSAAAAAKPIAPPKGTPYRGKRYQEDVHQQTLTAFYKAGPHTRTPMRSAPTRDPYAPPGGLDDDDHPLSTHPMRKEDPIEDEDDDDDERNTAVLGGNWRTTSSSRVSQGRQMAPKTDKYSPARSRHGSLGPMRGDSLAPGTPRPPVHATPQANTDFSPLNTGRAPASASAASVSVSDDHVETIQLGSRTVPLHSVDEDTPTDASQSAESAANAACPSDMIGGVDTGLSQALSTASLSDDSASSTPVSKASSAPQDPSHAAAPSTKGLATVKSETFTKGVPRKPIPTETSIIPPATPPRVKMEFPSVPPAPPPSVDAVSATTAPAASAAAATVAPTPTPPVAPGTTVKTERTSSPPARGSSASSRVQKAKRGPGARSSSCSLVPDKKGARTADLLTASAAATTGPAAASDIVLPDSQ